MGTDVGVAYSIIRNPAEAGKEAAQKALERAGITTPDLVLVFATIGYNQQLLIQAIREATSGAPLSGCSGEGIITQETVNESNFCVSVMVIRSDELRFHNSFAKDLSRGAGIAGEQLAQELVPQLAADSIACILFPDGLNFDFDPFLTTFEKTLSLQTPLPLLGGFAADNCTSLKTFQYFNDDVLSDAVACVVISGKGNIACGISHGCMPVGAKRTITRSKGNIIYEIDGMPALEALGDYFEDGWKSKWNRTSLNLCLGFESPGHIRQEYGNFIIRYMMGKDDHDGSVRIQSDVQNGTGFWIVRRDKELICTGMQTLSRQIKSQLGGRKPKFMLHFDCVGRGKVVFREQEKIELIKSIQNDIGADTPWLGFYTYGEIGPLSGLNCSHNFTAVLAAIF